MATYHASAREINVLVNAAPHHATQSGCPAYVVAHSDGTVQLTTDVSGTILYRVEPEAVIDIRQTLAAHEAFEMYDRVHGLKPQIC